LSWSEKLTLVALGLVTLGAALALWDLTARLASALAAAASLPLVVLMLLGSLLGIWLRVAWLLVRSVLAPVLALLALPRQLLGR
jgi:hypothetical protein